MSREKVTSSKSRQSLTREVFIFKRNVDFLVGCQISLYRLQTSNILILIFSPQYSQLHIIPGRSSVRYLFCRQARQAIFLSQCFLLFLLWSVRKGNWTLAICTFLLKRPIDLQDLKTLNFWIVEVLSDIFVQTSNILILIFSLFLFWSVWKGY